MLRRLIKNLVRPRANEADAALQFDRHIERASRELPGEDYVSLLAYLHTLLEPRTYIEIGVATGKTVALAHAGTRAVGVDPAPKITHALSGNVRICSETSDAFFARDGVRAELGGSPVDFAFIDGLHLCEFVLRDFLNLERHAAPGAVIAIHDCYPLDASTSARERGSVYWTGDVWRAVVALRRHRPDLALHTLASPPSGLALVTRLDPASGLLAARYNDVVREMHAIEYAEIAERKAEMLNMRPASRVEIASLVASART